MHANALLASMSAADHALIAPHLEPVDLAVRLRLARKGAVVDALYFIQSGIASVTTSLRRGPQIEVGIIGREGAANYTLLLGTDRSAHDVYMQVGGAGLRVAAGPFLAALTVSPTLAAVMLRSVQVFVVQTASTVLANGRATLSERLARWLLMAHDRMDGDKIGLTHVFLATMLGVRRPGVTIALGDFERRALIKAMRGNIVILDRGGLEAIANGYYGAAEAEFERLFAS